MQNLKQIKAILEKLVNLTSISEGNEIAFREFIVAYSPGIYKYIYRILKDYDWTEEVVCDVFIAVWNNRKKLAEIQNTNAWLYKIAHNKSVSFLRKESRWSFRCRNISEFSEGFEFNYIEDATNRESEICNKETIEALNNAIAGLPDKCRIVLYLAKIEKFSYKEISEILDISVKTVSNHMTYAMKRLHQNMKQQIP